MDALIDRVASLPEGDPVRVLTETRQGERVLYAFEPAVDYWPTELLTWQLDEGWSRGPVPEG